MRTHAAQSTRTSRGELKLFQTYIHPALLKKLKIAAIQEDMDIPGKLHAILCDEFDMPDLLPMGSIDTAMSSAN